uniref:Uncharacterized protein n=1 Tax=Florenciella parvula TaxID=236787 RepID=A0A7S2FDQ2_9STRA|mmetsp:Transcript_13077/g.27644  ORF Transcript_13077/g.27644 Transcript_13077/m.27644 type:complete len:166 (+) Transcript_13077:465-962(+)
MTERLVAENAALRKRPRGEEVLSLQLEEAREQLRSFAEPVYNSDGDEVGQALPSAKRRRTGEGESGCGSRSGEERADLGDGGHGEGQAGGARGRGARQGGQGGDERGREPAAVRGVPGRRAWRAAGAMRALRAVRGMRAGVRGVPDLPRGRGGAQGGGTALRARC